MCLGLLTSTAPLPTCQLCWDVYATIFNDLNAASSQVECLVQYQSKEWWDNRVLLWAVLSAVDPYCVLSMWYIANLRSALRASIHHEIWLFIRWKHAAEHFDDALPTVWWHRYSDGVDRLVQWCSQPGRWYMAVMQGDANIFLFPTTRFECWEDEILRWIREELWRKSSAGSVRP